MAALQRGKRRRGDWTPAAPADKRPAARSAAARTAVLLLCCAAADATSATAALEQLSFGEPSVVRATDEYATVSVTQPSLNSGLWSAASIISAEVPFAVTQSSHVLPGSPGGGGVMESVLNLSAAPSCTATVKLLPITGGVATLPTSGSATCSLGTAHGLAYEQCVSHCCSQLNCSAFAWYDMGPTSDLHEGTGRCQTYTRDYTVGPQGFGPTLPVRAAKGGVLTVLPAQNDDIANGLRSGTWLGGVGTGGYEIRADGSFHLSTIRNQSPAAEPWQATMRDMVLAVAVDGQSHIIRLQPFGNLSAVPQIVYNDAFPVARLRFLGNLTLYAHGLIRPGDSNTSNTPAVVYTLRTTNQKLDGTPLKLSFLVAGAVFRNDWRQVGSPLLAASSAYTTRSACAAACSTLPDCHAWQFELANHSCFLDHSSYAQGANLQGVDSGFPGNFTYSPIGVSFNTRILQPPSPSTASSSEPQPRPRSLPRGGAAAAVGPNGTLSCETAPQMPGVTITGTAATRKIVADGEAGLNDCRSSCCKEHNCHGWVVANKTAPPGAKSAPCAANKACCWMMTGAVKQGGAGAATWATSSVWHPGGSGPSPPSPPPPLPPSEHQLHNGLGSEGFYVLPGQDSSHIVGSGSASSIEDLLAVLNEPVPAQALSTHRNNAAGGGFQAVAVTAAAVAHGDTVSLSVAHTWYFPHYFWYRDTHSGSDNGVRYSERYHDAESVATSINLQQATQSIADWHSIYDGLPSALLRDAALNLFNHVRSAAWHRNEDSQYRQWESYEFADYMNPTNGDERHVPYFAYVPETMKSKLLTEVNLLQEPTGMFPCVVVGAAGDNQFSDPCEGQTDTHPDDITMMLIAAHEQYSLANDTALVAQIWPKLKHSFSFYKTYYDTAPWSVPYMTHETYDAVKESAAVQGEGNLGSSLYNAVNYLLGLHIIRELAGSQSDATTVAESQTMIHRVQKSIQMNFWQPAAGFYIGDTVRENTYLLEKNGWPYHSSDDLHGQVLAYRLGFGDLLPRRQMQLHQQYILRDLDTEWGLQFDDYSKQNWLMSDHSHASLLLRWNEDGGWDTSLRQIRYWREQKREMTKNTAVIDTNSGNYGLLNYYGYALFFYHTINNWAGQRVHLPNRTLSFTPHHTAFNASGIAVLPILLGGELGTLTVTPTAATFHMKFLSQPLSFDKVTICQHTFDAAAPHVLRLQQPYTLALSSPCAMATEVAAVVSTPRCRVSPGPTGSSQWAHAAIPNSSPNRTNVTLATCQQLTIDHHYCGYEYWRATSTCVLVAGSACTIVSKPLPSSDSVLGKLSCNYTDVTTARVNVTNVMLHTAKEFANFSLTPNPAAPSVLPSAVYTIALPTAEACQAQGAAQQACGFLFVEGYAGPDVGGCTAAAKRCCFLNPYLGCRAATAGAGAPPTGKFTRFGAATLGIFSALK